jgi:hypothetical protein
LLGITIDLSVDFENADDPIRITREFDLNEMDESDLHSRKHDEPRILTLLGMTIDLSDDHENASDSIYINSEFDSKEIE